MCSSIHVEAGFVGTCRRPYEGVAHPSMSARVISRGAGQSGPERLGRRAERLPGALRCRQRHIVPLPRMPSPSPCVRRGRAGWRSCAAELRVHEVDDALPGHRMLGRVHSRAAWRDPPCRRDVGHLGDRSGPRRRWPGCQDAPGASRRDVPSRAEYWHIGLTTIAIDQLHRPQTKRREDGRWRRAV